MLFYLRLARAALAAVARDEHSLIRETIDRNRAAVLADAAAAMDRLDSKILKLIRRQQTGARSAFLHASLLGQKRASISAHEPCQIRTDDFPPGDLLEGSQHRIIHKRAALDDDAITQFLDRLQFDDFIEGIHHHRVSQAGGNIRDACPFLLHLFHLRIHENGAA